MTKVSRHSCSHDLHKKLELNRWNLEKVNIMKRTTVGTPSEEKTPRMVKAIALPFTLRAVVATVLCASFVMHPQLQVVTTKAAPVTEIKSDSQYKNEASLYEGALRAIAGIATMKLDTPDELKQALAIFDRARPNLMFFSSKLVVIARNDPTFSNAVKKKTSTKQAAQTFLAALKADPKIVSELDGAASLTTRLQQIAQADAASLRRVAERLKEVAEKIKKTSQAKASHDLSLTINLIRAGFKTSSTGSANPSTMPTPDVIVGLILFAAAVVLIIIVFKEFTAPPAGPDPVAECLLGPINERYQRCLNDASNLPFPLDSAAKAVCVAAYLAETAACLLTP